jgi:hypothetical protein
MSEFEASLMYKMTSTLAKAAQTGLKKKKNNKKKSSVSNLPGNQAY